MAYCIYYSSLVLWCEGLLTDDHQRRRDARVTLELGFQLLSSRSVTLWESIRVLTLCCAMRDRFQFVFLPPPLSVSEEDTPKKTFICYHLNRAGSR